MILEAATIAEPIIIIVCCLYNSSIYYISAARLITGSQIKGMIMLMLLSLSLAQLQVYRSSGSWTLDYQEGICLLTRPFTSAASKSTLGFRQAPADYQSEIIVLYSSHDDGARHRGFVRVQFPGYPTSTLTGLAVSYRVPGGRERLLRFLVPRQVLADFADTKEIIIEELGKPVATFKAESARNAIEALKGCESDQMKAWGVDFAKMAIPAKPIGDIAQWFSFPPLAAANKDVGETTIRWMIGVNGKVSDCTVVRSSGNGILDQSACTQVEKRATYQPALDKDGHPMTWIETRRIVWSLG